MSPDDDIVLPAAPPVRHRPPLLTVIAVLVLAVLTMALIVVGYTTRALAKDRDGWRRVAGQVQAQNDELRAQVSDQSAEIACRSRANFNTVRATGEVIKVVSQLVEAQGNPEKVSAIRPMLTPAIAALDNAIAAQDAAIPGIPGASSTCTSTPP